MRFRGLASEILPRNCLYLVRMTDLSLAASPTATPLAAWLASGASKPSLSPYHGVLTPTELDVRAVETEALVRDAAVHDLGWLRRVQVRGEDRSRWLSGMVTNMVSDLPSSTGAYNLVLTAQGRIQGDLTVWREGDTLEIETTLGQVERLLGHLEHFIIMDDVELVPVDGQTALGLTGPKASEVLERLGIPRLPQPMTEARLEWNGLDLHLRRNHGVCAEHYEIWTRSAMVEKVWKFALGAGATPVGSAALEAARVAEGIPAYAIDIAERDLPQETAQTRALSFNKGCYLGQEIVERIRSRGNVHRHLRHLQLDGPLPARGVELTLNGNAVGTITSAEELSLSSGPRRFALAMVRAEAEVGDQVLNYTAETATGTARLLAAPPSF